jgi:hypothetical protein
VSRRINYDKQNDKFTCDESFKNCEDGIKDWLEDEHDEL